MITQKLIYTSVVDLGFPVGGCQPPMWVLFGKNICENERIGSCSGGTCQQHPPGSANAHADGYDLTWMSMNLIQMVYYPTDSCAGATTDIE